MLELVLASAGKSVKLWEGENCVLSQQIHSPSNVSQVCWSPNGQFLASSSLNQPKVPVYFYKKPLTQPLELLPETPQSYIRFGNTSSRFVVTCGNHPAVTIWDLKTRKATKKLNIVSLGEFRARSSSVRRSVLWIAPNNDDIGRIQSAEELSEQLRALNAPIAAFLQTGLTDGVTCAAYNTGDTHVASGGHDGSVVLTNVVSSVSLAPMVPSFAEPQAITSMQFSPMQKNLLGTVSDDGSCVLWDCNARLLLHSTHIHVAPAMGIAFSPTNELLLATVGLDKRLFYHDIQFKKTVATVKLESPSTCVDFSPDGMYVAVGGYKGSISIYDVRSAHSPVSVISAHKKAVNAVSFNKLPSAIKDSYFRPNDTIQNTSASRRSLENGIHTPERDNLRDSNSNCLSDILSPVRDWKQPEIASLTTQDPQSFNELPQQNLSTHNASEDNPSNVRHLANVSSSQDLPDPELASLASTESSITVSLNSEICTADVNVVANIPSSARCLEDGTDALYGAAHRLVEQFNNNVDDAITNTSIVNGPPSEQWREEMKLEMQRVRLSLHHDIVNLQMEMIKNFFKQKNEFEEMFGYRNLAANLMAEVNALKKEISDLKKHY